MRIDRLSIIGFDTRAVNQLSDDPRASLLIAALHSGFSVILPAVAVDEVLSTPEKKNLRREHLLATCQRLLGSGRCLWPPHSILEILISAHCQNPSEFDWTKIETRSQIYERALIDRDFTSALCVQQRKEQFELERSYEKFWKELRPKLDAILAGDPSKRPASYTEAIAIALRKGGVLWGIGERLYRHVTGRVLTESEVRAFGESCPPFRAAYYALAMSWYILSLKPKLPSDRKPAGRNDLMMATYLPYCGTFLTDESSQETSLREIAAAASIDCEVVSYEAFCATLVINA